MSAVEAAPPSASGPTDSAEPADCPAVEPPTPPPALPPVKLATATLKSLFSVRHRCCRTTRRLRPVPTPPTGPEALVGQTVELLGLKSKPELNGRRGRVLNYSPETGRAGVLLRSIKAFGAVEKITIALLPTNLQVIEVAAAMQEDGAATWAVLLDHLQLPYLKHIPWWAHEEAIGDALMPKPPNRPSALAELVRAGVDEEVDREAIIDGLLSPSSGIFHKSHASLSVLFKLVAVRVQRLEKEDQAKFDKQRAASEADSKSGVPPANAKFRISTGRVCDQRHGKLDDDVARPPLEKRKLMSNRMTVYPTPVQADQIVGLLRSRTRSCVCIGWDERVFEGMLERRGVSVVAVDADTFQDADAYYERRIYCREVRRVGIDSLQLIVDPPATALIFVNGFLAHWEAYLAHYPQLPLVLIIGDDASTAKGHFPRPAELESRKGFRLLRRMAVDCHEAPPLTLAAYESVRS